MRTADSRLLTNCPPGPDERQKSMRMSSGRIFTAPFFDFGRMATVAVEVWIRPFFQ